MTADQMIAFAIVVVMMGLFIWNRLRFDIVAALGLVAAVMTGVVTPDDAFVGFGDQIVIIVASALILSAGVSKSSIIERLVRKLEPAMKTTGLQVLVLSGTVMVLSAFMKNVAALAIFLPIALQVAQRANTPPSKLLMPMAFGSLVGGLVTLIGTSPNIIVARMRAELLGEPYTMFSFAPVGIAIALGAFAFLSIGWRLLPANRKGEMDAAASFEVEPYLSEAVLPEDSPLVERTVAELEALSGGDVTVVAIIRENRHRYIPEGHWVLFAQDVLVLQSSPHALRKIVNAAGLRLQGSDKRPDENLPAAKLSAVEAVVTTGSPLIGNSAEELRLRERYGTNLIAVSRKDQRISQKLHQVRFELGDVLVLQGSAAAMLDNLKDLHCLPLVDRSTRLGEPRQEYLALILLAAAMTSASIGLIPVPAAFFAAAVLLVIFRGLTITDAYNAIDLPILVLLACLIPISDAIRTTGGADLIAGWLAIAAGDMSPTGAMCLMLVTAMALTPFLNNAATVLIMAPVGVSLAGRLSLNPDPFLMAVAIGAACDFLTPIGHQCNTLVMGAGGYRFGDYWRLGLPLSVIVVVISTVLIPVFWPLG
jgi:di/tricarboxylate transporter